ncbi:hypothetical protein HY086_00200 [Candidatus Gottesmanbacteria bacterium]|nr:hypothetical protein [Candidatus Gottesmanbacteria bacterium]
MRRIPLVLLFVALAILSIACASTSPALSPQGAFAAVVPTRMPTLDPVDEALIPSALPSGFVGRTTNPTKTWRTPEGVQYAQYGEISVSEKLALVLPMMATLAIAEGPSPAMKVVATVTVMGYGTMYLVEHRDQMSAAFVGTFVEVDKMMRQMPAVIVAFPQGDSLWQSTKHGDPVGDGWGRESADTVARVLQRADPINRRVGTSAPGTQNGTYVFAGLTDQTDTGATVTIAILSVDGLPGAERVDFVTLHGSARVGPAAGFQRIANTRWYFDPLKLVYECAWIISTKEWNGHKAAPPETWLTAGQGWDWWLRVSTRYQTVIPLGYVPLPIHPLKDWRN